MVFLLVGLYLFFWSIQSAWLSINPAIHKIDYYENKAILLFLLSIIIWIFGLIMFLFIKK